MDLHSKNVSYVPHMHRTYAKKYLSYSKLHEEHNGDPAKHWIPFCGLLELDKFAKPPKKVKNFKKKNFKVPKKCQKSAFSTNGGHFSWFNTKNWPKMTLGVPKGP